MESETAVKSQVWNMHRILMHNAHDAQTHDAHMHSVRYETPKCKLQRITPLSEVLCDVILNPPFRDGSRNRKDAHKPLIVL